MHIKYVREINEGKIVCVFKEKKERKKVGDGNYLSFF